MYLFGGAMFTGRAHELAELNRLYRRGGFQMVVLYGRRRVGKTTLALEFAKDKPHLFFTAKVQSDAMNLARFSQEVYRFVGLAATPGPFSTWDDAFAFLAESVGERQVVFLFDEFPYAAQKNASLVSTLQIAVDHHFSQTNIFFILTGSNQGFMEEKVLGSSSAVQDESGLGEKNPLFGRRTSQIHLGPLDYLDAARMLPGVDPVDLVSYYACFGGTPYYLAQIDTKETLAENVERLFFRKEGLLFEEPLMLLRQELREPAVYSSIMSAIANGATKSTRIADRVGIERTAMGKYLGALRSLGLVEKVAPYGENRKTSKNAIYRLKDPCFAYWYRFVEPVSDVVEQDAGELVAQEALANDQLATYVGHWFEEISRAWILAQAKAGQLPFTPVRFGSWWGTNPEVRAQDEVDVVAGNPRTKELIVGECKWRADVNVREVLDALQRRTRLFSEYSKFFPMVFLKHELGGAGQAACEAAGCRTIDVEELYRDR